MNKTLEKLPQVYEHKTELLKRKIRDSTIQCRNEQEKAYPEIMSLTKKRLDSFLSTMNCQQAILALSTDLVKRGVDVAAFEAREEENKRRKLDPNNPEYNTTVRQYEAGNTDAASHEMEVC